MKHFYKLQTALLLIIAFLAVFKQGNAQTLTINANAPRNNNIVVSNKVALACTLTNINYVRLPEGLTIDSIDASGLPFVDLRLSWMTYCDTAGITANIATTKTAYSSDHLNYTISANKPRFGVSAKLKDGTIVCEDFLATYPTTPPDQYHNFPHIYYTSTNNGASYAKHTDGVIKFPAPGETVYGLKMQHSLIEDQDTLYTCAYVRHSFSTIFRPYILKSADKGKTWVSMLKSGAAIEILPPGFAVDAHEATLSRCANGTWLVIIKEEGPDPDTSKPFWYSRSSNRGQTWSAPARLPASASAAIGKAPEVLLMPNGVLALSYGTPDVAVSFSANDGVSWTTPIATYPDTTGHTRPSGNTWLSAIDQNTILQYADYYAKTTPTNNQGLWQQKIEIVRPEQNRIDLQGKLKAGTLTVVSPTTNMNATFPSHIEARANAAFDGSVNYWASAISTVSGSGDYVLDLHQTYHIKGIGLALLFGVQESATVQLSTDGSNWLSPVVTYTNKTHYCLNYTSFAAVDARYVKVHVTGTGQVGLSELEIYQTASTLENNATMALGYPNYPHGILPTGYAPAGTSSALYGAGVLRGGYGYQSDRALVLDDNSSTYIAGVKKIVSPSSTKTLEFRCRPSRIDQSFSWRVLGTVSGVESTVFFFAVFAETSGSTTTYKIKANDGTGWTQVGTATLPVSGSVWKLIKVEASNLTDSAKLYVDGTYAGKTKMYSNPANTTNLTGFSFNSNGTGTVGEFVYFDDIDFYDTTVGPTQYDAVNPDKLLPTVLADQPEVSKVFSVNASPNPANGQARINVSNAQNGNITVYVSNMAGKIVKKFTYQAQQGNSSTTVSIQGYLPGVYIITAKQNAQVAQSKLDVY